MNSVAFRVSEAVVRVGCRRTLASAHSVSTVASPVSTPAFAVAMKLFQVARTVGGSPPLQKLADGFAVFDEVAGAAGSVGDGGVAGVDSKVVIDRRGDVFGT